MSASALVYLTSLHPDRERRASRGGPSGEMAMAASLLAGLEDLGIAARRTGTLRGFLRLRAGQILRFHQPTVAFLDPWSLALASRYLPLPRRSSTRPFILEWFGTTEAAIPASAALTPRDYLVPYRYPGLANRFLGFMLRSPSGAFFANASELTVEFERSLEKPRRFGVVWGKEPRYFGPGERALIRALATRAPMHLTVEWGDTEALSGDGIVNHGHLEPRVWRELLLGARFVLGLGDPILGPTALEALAAGAVLLNPSFTPSRLVDGNPGISFGSQHPVAAAIGPPHVLGVDLAEPDQVIRTVEALVRAGPASGRRCLPEGLADFTRDAYRSRLAAILSEVETSA
ncbi:MAG: hypothetical protein K1Y01_11320 [Vicinamibacteria bacterium]|nr:hypothetical protein [Vicinamibacteria bacterium]